jgi:hypothetical protein
MAAIFSAEQGANVVVKRKHNKSEAKDQGSKIRKCLLPFSRSQKVSF